MLGELRHDGPVYRAAFGGNGRLVTGAYPDARVWDLETARLCARLEHVTTVTDAAFSSDGGRIVTASIDNTAAVWEADTGRSIARLRHDDFVTHASFTTGGQHVLTASWDGTARVWDPASGRQVFPACKHNGRRVDGVLGPLAAPC